MTTTRRGFLYAGAAIAAGAAAWSWRMTGAEAGSMAKGTFPVSYTPDEWRARLTPAQYDVLREAGTERAFTSALLEEHRKGTFACAGCDLDLFSSETKFESGTGWPSFWQPLEKAVSTDSDTSYGMMRTEVHCSRCGGHLGHVFDDGPQPTGLRYCMNGVALTFKPAAA
jgi:peptide-methionine (R)-S-oxide reductase